MTFLKSFVAGLTAGIFLITADPAAAERRLALVIGNGAYTHAAPLTNPVNDAQAMSNKLEGLGFETYVGLDLDKFGMERLLRDFARASRESDVNLFFYAGHGMSVDGVNYLVPVDAEFADETALDFEAVAVDFVTRQMSMSDAVNLIFLDACRDNPLATTLSRSMGATRSSAVSRGLAEMKVPDNGKGMAVAFATSPGNVALDGDGINSPFTTALLNHLGAENTDITEVFSRVTGDVYNSTNQSQRPWLNVSLTGPVMLNRVNRIQNEPTVSSDVSATAPTAVAGATQFLEEQKLLFNLARETGDIVDYKAYLETFPDGLYANNARRMIQRLQSEQGGAQVAMRTQQPQSQMANTRSAAINEIGPLALMVTGTVRSQVTSQATEALLDFNRTYRGNVQARLNATGNNVGGVDGVWGRNTRTGISNWQASNGLQPTGFLSQTQYELLVAQTEGRYVPYTGPTASSGNRTSSKSSGGGGNGLENALGAIATGAAIGILLGNR